MSFNPVFSIRNMKSVFHHCILNLVTSRPAMAQACSGCRRQCLNPRIYLPPPLLSIWYDRDLNPQLCTCRITDAIPESYTSVFTETTSATGAQVVRDGLTDRQRRLQADLILSAFQPALEQHLLPWVMQARVCTAMPSACRDNVN